MKPQPERALIRDEVTSECYKFPYGRNGALAREGIDTSFRTVTASSKYVEMEHQPERAFSGNSYHKKVVYVYHRKDVALLLRSKGVAAK